MFLRSIEIKNYRSLEDVRLDHLGHFNVLIGRNNSGKSSVFNALRFLSSVMYAQNVTVTEGILTAQDPTRALEISLTVDFDDDDRDEYFALLRLAPGGQTFADFLSDSPFMRHVGYTFRAPAGNPGMLTAHETWTHDESGNRRTIQQLADKSATNADPTSTLVDLWGAAEESSTQFQGNAPSVNTRKVMNLGLGTDTSSHPVMSVRLASFPYHKLVMYLHNAFFFDPYRHGMPRMAAQEANTLNQDGANLAQVLNTCHNNDISLFGKIEGFVHGALPNIGIMHTPLTGNGTYTGFRTTPGNFLVPISDMGGGIEQLLMIATVLCSTSDGNALFIEEPESHLHAGAQRYLIERLYEGNRQVFITTHSPTFINLTRPLTIYQVSQEHERTTIQPRRDINGLADVLDDIGARNSDVLLSDAVLFVEGPSDAKVMEIWSEKLGQSLDSRNVTILPMGGGEHAERGARARSEVLEGISGKAQVPHLFVIDRDERSTADIERIRRTLAEHIHILEKRELENYLLVPRALLEAVRTKYKDNAPVREHAANFSPEDVATMIRTAAGGLYGTVLLKRIRSQIPGLADGLLTRADVASLSQHATRGDLHRKVSAALKQRFGDHLRDCNVEQIVRRETARLNDEWRDEARRLELAPGEEVIQAVFNKVGGEYKKPNDTVRIASEMREGEIDLEISTLLRRVAAMVPQSESAGAS